MIVIKIMPAIKQDGIFSFHYFLFSYGKYHNNGVNQALHMVFIPLILFSGFTLLCNYAPWVDLGVELPLIGNMFNLIGLYLFINDIVYFLVEPLIGLIFTIWSTGVIVLGQHLWQHKEDFTLTVGDHTYSMMYWMTVLHVFSWIAQFYGHGVHEKRAPALLTNLLFANLAPFFVIFEILNGCFGYKEGPEMDKVRVAIEEDIRDYHAPKKNKTQ